MADENNTDLYLHSNGINKQPSSHHRPPHVTARLCMAAFGAVLGSFQFGYNTGVINSPEANIKAFMNETQLDRNGEGLDQMETTNLYALLVAMFAAGGCLGGFFAGWWSDFFGRKKGLLLNTFIGIIGGLLMYFSHLARAYEMIIVGRLIIGINCGLYTGLSPMYLFEISTAKIRGAFGVLHQLGVTIGILVSQIFGFSELLGNDRFWDLLLGLTILPCLFQLVILPLCPESPRYLLITKHKEQDAILVLETLRGTSFVEDEIAEMKHEAEVQGREEKVTVLTLFIRRFFWMPLMISIVMHLSQQLSGINGIFYYSARLFENAGVDPQVAKYATSGVGAVMVVMTLVTIPLMDRVGRRTLHLTGLGGMLVFSILITVTLSLKEKVAWFNYLSVVVSIIYVIFFALGPGSVPWLIVAELFSQGPRPAAMSVAVLVNWISNFIVGYTFPHLNDALGSYTFVPFSVLLFLFLLFTYFYVKETKNQTFEEVSHIWRQKDNARSESSRLVEPTKKSSSSSL